MALSRLLSCATSAWLLAGCAHTADADGAGAPADEREVTVLRERVSRLERRLSDLDAQVTLLSAKKATDVASEAPRTSVSSGSLPAYEPDPNSYASPAPSQQAWNASPPAEPAYDARRGWQNDAGMRSIDLGPGPPRYAAAEAPQVMAVDVEDASFEASAETPSAEVSSASEPQGGPPRGDAQTVYEWAHARMQDGRYLEAVAAFEDVLARHGGHDLADNALYWTGACHLERGEPRLAIDTWKALPLRFPKSPKMPDSLYGMALAHEELGEPVLAETLYGQLLQQFPKAEKIGEAKKALKRLRGSPDAPR